MPVDIPELPNADVKPTTSLLSLSDELLERIFTEYYLEERQAHFRKPHAPILVICKRVSTLVERLWLQTIRFHASREKTELFLSDLTKWPPDKRAAVRDLEIYVHPDSTVLIYAAIADLPSLRSLCLRLVGYSLQDYKGRPLGTADSRGGLQRVFEHCVNLRRLQVTSQSLPLESCRLPAKISDVTLDAATLGESTAANLQQAGITRLELHFHREVAATAFADLPWSSLRRLVLVFHDNDMEGVTGCIQNLALQSLDGSKATSLQALEIKLMDGVADGGEPILDHLRCAFQQCSMTHLAVYADATGLDLALTEEWPSLKHLILHLSEYTFLDHRFDDFVSLLEHYNELVSLTLRGVDLSSCECCYMGVEEFFELDEKKWARRGRNLIAVVYLVRHQTEILDLRIQSDDGCHELRWTRTDGADDFALGRWTLF